MIEPTLDVRNVIFGNGAPGDSTAIVFEGRTRTYRGLRMRATEVAHELIDLGVGPHDLVGIVMDNSLEVWDANFGIWVAGAVTIPFNHRLADEEILGLVAFSGVQVVVTDGARPALEESIRRVGVEVLDIADDVIGDRIRARGARAHDDAEPKLAPEARPTDLAEVIFTSGSTGTPKGVMHTHQSVIWKTVAMALDNNVDYTDRAFIVVGSNYVGGRATALPPLQRGGQVHLRRSGKFDGASFVDYAKDHGVTRTVLSLPMLQDVVEELETRGAVLESFRVMAAGGMAFDKEILQRANAVLPNAHVYQPFGQTETSPVTVHRRHRADSDPTSCGTPALHVRITIVDPKTMEIVEPGEEGEVVVQSPGNSVGLLNADDSAMFCAYGLRTGDIGRVDEAGDLWITGRLKELIISGGMNIYPSEVEETLVRHPGVAEVAVIGVPDPRWGESVLAVIVPADAGEPPTLEALQEFSRLYIASFKKPTRILLLDSLPQTDIGKVKRSILKQIWVEFSGDARTVVDGRSPRATASSASSGQRA